MQTQFFVGNVNATKQVSELALENLALQAEVERLNQKLTEQEDRIEAVRVDNSRLRDKVNNLEKIVDRVKRLRQELRERKETKVSIRHLLMIVARILEPEHNYYGSIFEPSERCNCIACVK